MTLRRRILIALAGTATVAALWAVPAYARAHESMNECYKTYVAVGRPHLSQPAVVTPLAGDMLGNWQVCVHEISTDD